VRRRGKGKWERGQAIVTVWISATLGLCAIPETDADHIGLGDTCGAAARRNGGFGKSSIGGRGGFFATQRDVGRRKRDIPDDCFESAVENPKEAYVPGMNGEC